MSDMNEKKLYVYRLASSLYVNRETMSGRTLAEHLNQNGFLTSYGTEYQGGRGTYRLIGVTWKWVNDEHGLREAQKVAKAFVKPDGSYAYE